MRDAPWLIVLKPPEVSFALAVAIQRDACKPEHLRDNRVSKKHSAFGVHFAGVVGELCARKVYGGTLNTKVLRNGDGHLPDLTLSDGQRVEVKANLFNGRDIHLRFELDELDRVELACLVGVTLPDQGLVYPIVTRAVIVECGKSVDYGYGARLSLSADAILREARR